MNSSSSTFGGKRFKPSCRTGALSHPSPEHFQVTRSRLPKHMFFSLWSLSFPVASDYLSQTSLHLLSIRVTLAKATQVLVGDTLNALDALQMCAT